MFENVNKNEYTGRVLIGPWVDRFQREREQQAKIDEKRAKGELPEQKLERLVCSFTKSVTLPPPKEPADCIRMNQHVQLHCPEIPDMRYYLEGRLGCPDEIIPPGPKQFGLIVAATVARWQAEEGADRIGDGCGVSCTATREPLSRNVFIVRPVSMAIQGDDDVLTYGREFYLELAHSCQKLYLRSERPLIDGIYGPKFHNPVKLSVERDCYTKWKAFYWDKRYRFETEGAPVQPCARVIIQHVMTGMCLAAETDVWHRSLFDYEAGISTFTYRDADHIETSECIWNFLVGGPNNNCVQKKCS